MNSHADRHRQLSNTVLQSVDLPYEPRRWQAIAHRGMRGKNNAVLICSRQIGKTVCALIELIDRTKNGPPDHDACYLSPAATQARRIAWPKLKHYLAPLLQFGASFRETEMVATLPEGRRIYCLGAESGDNIRGASFRTILCDERDNISDEFWRSVMLPTTNAWGAAASIIYIGTLSGGDSILWKMYLDHRDDPDWYCGLVSGPDSGVLTDEHLARKRIEMGESAYRREILCDPTAPVEHAVLSEEMAAVERDGNIGPLPWKEGYPILTSWDLGIRDFTTVWGFCLIGRWIHIMFYREYSGIGMAKVIPKLLEEFHQSVPQWGTAILPHDARNRGKEFGLSTVDVFDQMWPADTHVFTSAPDPAATLIATRKNLPICLFDDRRADLGLIRLRSAKYVVNARTSTVSDTILHDDNSHGLDAFRYGMHYVEMMHGATPDAVFPGPARRSAHAAQRGPSAIDYTTGWTHPARYTE